MLAHGVRCPAPTKGRDNYGGITRPTVNYGDQGIFSVSYSLGGSSDAAYRS